MPLTKYVSAVTILTAETANSWYGGLFGDAAAVGLDADDPLVAGHIHDGQHIDGHAQKINLADHVTGELDGILIQDSTITASKLSFTIDSSLTIQDDGFTIGGGPHSTLDFVGAGVVVTDAGGETATITISGGGSGGGETLNETLAIGNNTGNLNILVDTGDSLLLGTSSEGALTYGLDSIVRLDSADVTGPSVSSVTAPVYIGSGVLTTNDVGVASASGDARLFTGNTTTTAAGTAPASGAVSIFTGDAASGSGTSGQSGDVSILTGTSSDAKTGDVFITTGTSGAANSGGITIATGAGTTLRGDIELSAEKVISNNKVFTKLSTASATGTVDLEDSVSLPGVLITNTAAGTHSQVCFFKIVVVGHAPAAAETATWTIEGAVQRELGTDTLSLPTPPIVTPYYNPYPVDWNVQVVADDVTKQLKVQVTNDGFGAGPGAADPLSAVAEIELTVAVPL